MKCLNRRIQTNSSRQKKERTTSVTQSKCHFCSIVGYLLRVFCFSHRPHPNPPHRNLTPPHPKPPHHNPHHNLTPTPSPNHPTTTHHNPNAKPPNSIVVLLSDSYFGYTGFPAGPTPTTPPHQHPPHPNSTQTQTQPSPA